MELLPALQWRYTAKRMNGIEIPPQKLNAILDAVCLSPSFENLQPYTLVLIGPAALKSDVITTAGTQQQLAGASHLLIFAAWNDVTLKHVHDHIHLTATTWEVDEEGLSHLKGRLLPLVYQSKEDNVAWSANQAYIALGIGLAAAAMQGVDATPMEVFNKKVLDDYLGISKKGLHSVVMLALGYRDENNDPVVHRPKVRRPKEKFIILPQVKQHGPDLSLML